MQKLKLNDVEKEIIILKSAVESIDAAVNYEVLTRSGSVSESEIQFKSRTHQKYFGIILLDFLTSKIISVQEPCFKALLSVTNNPLLGSGSEPLRAAVNEFNSWLERDVQFERDGDTTNLWFPSIEQEIALKVTRVDFIKVCGNISKHNALSLTHQAEVIQNIFARNGINIDVTQTFNIMKEFYEQFHDGIFAYHGSTITELLNNIRWAIHEYLQPEYARAKENYWSEQHRMTLYRFRPLAAVSNSFATAVHWDLMNDVRSGPIVPRFTVSKLFKMRY